MKKLLSLLAFLIGSPLAMATTVDLPSPVSVSSSISSVEIVSVVSPIDDQGSWEVRANMSASNPSWLSHDAQGAVVITGGSNYSIVIRLSRSEVAAYNNMTLQEYNDAKVSDLHGLVFNAVMAALTEKLSGQDN